MFITKEAIREQTGVDVDNATLATAHAMIEAWVGKSEEDVVDGTDRAILGRATMFQAVYINGQALHIMEQVGLKKITVGSTNHEFDTSMFAPYMSPWAVMTCKRLSWKGTRTVHTGPIFDVPGLYPAWERD